MKTNTQPKKSVKVASHRNSESVTSPQGQRLIPIITQAVSGTSGLSGGMVVMPPGKTSRPHLHTTAEMIVVVVEGYAATMIGEDMEPVFHGPGEFIFIPEGVIHTAVNLSTTERLVAIEMRSDPHFNEDVTVMPELEEKVAKAAAVLHKKFADGTLDIPAHWDTKNGVFKFAD